MSTDQQCTIKALPSEMETTQCHYILESYLVRNQVSLPIIFPAIFIIALSQDSWQKISLFLGATNSIMNPIIYAFWYPEFRTRLARGWRRRKGTLFCYRENNKGTEIVGGQNGHSQRRGRKNRHKDEATNDNSRRERTYTI